MTPRYSRLDGNIHEERHSLILQCCNIASIGRLLEEIVHVCNLYLSHGVDRVDENADRIFQGLSKTLIVTSGNLNL
jgi:hypothetical protein